MSDNEMEGFKVLVLVAALIAAVVALLVAYWHRKQARQIELFRLDKSVGLEPPPSAAWQFLVRHQEFLTALLTIVLPIAGLTRVLSSPEPITRSTLIVIVLNIMSLLIGVTAISTTALLKQIGTMAATQDGILGIIRKLIDGSKQETDSILKLIERLSEGNEKGVRGVLSVIDKVQELNNKDKQYMLDLIRLRNKGAK